MTITMISSGIPIPNINASYGELDPLFTASLFKPELISSRFKVRGMVSGFSVQVSGKNVATETRLPSVA